MATVMDDLIVLGLMFLRLGIPMLVLMLMGALLNRTARTTA